MDSPSPALNVYLRLRNIAKLFRFIEIISVLSFLLWLSSQLPFAVKISGEYCRRFSAVVFNPVSIFLLGNSIVLALLAKSGLFNGNSNGKISDSVDIAVAELIEELRSDNRDGDIPVSGEEIVFQDKEIICEENINPKIIAVKSDAFFSDEMEKPSGNELKTYRRSQSENIRSESEEITEKIEKKLQRSETEIHRKDADAFAGGGKSTGEELPEGEDMSNEEFQRTIEAFIAKQIRFHRQERLAVVLHGQA